jgi:hypothetical protein
MEQGMPIPVVITVYSDRSFSFISKTPPAAVLLRKAAGIPKGSGEPNTNKVGKVNRAQLEDIATAKMPDLTAADMDAAVRTIAGSARSMGLEVEGVEGKYLTRSWIERNCMPLRKPWPWCGNFRQRSLKSRSTYPSISV